MADHDMVLHFPLPSVTSSRRATPAVGVAAHRGIAAVALVALGTTLVTVAPGEPAEAASRRTVRTVVRRSTPTTAPRPTSTLVPATVAVTPFDGSGATAATTTAPRGTVLLALGGPGATPGATPNPTAGSPLPGFVPLAPATAAPALAPEPGAAAAAPTPSTTTAKSKAIRSRSKGKTATTTTAPFVPLVGAGAATAPRVTPVQAGGPLPAIAAPTTASTAAPSTGSPLTITPVLGAAGGDARTLAAAAPTTTTLPGATTTTTPSYVFAQPSEPPPPVHPMVGAVLDAARALLGLPYIWAGEGPDGYDCSGLTMVAWRVAGINLIHNSGAQFNQTARVAMSDIQPGDLVFYGNPIHHEGIYIGDGKMIEAAKQGVPIRISSINRSDLVGIGRPRW